MPEVRTWLDGKQFSQNAFTVSLDATGENTTATVELSIAIPGSAAADDGVDYAVIRPRHATDGTWDITLTKNSQNLISGWTWNITGTTLGQIDVTVGVALYERL